MVVTGAARYAARVRVHVELCAVGKELQSFFFSCSIFCGIIPLPSPRKYNKQTYKWYVISMVRMNVSILSHADSEGVQVRE